jgi:hypothetical protein
MPANNVREISERSVDDMASLRDNATGRTSGRSLFINLVNISTPKQKITQPLPKTTERNKKKENNRRKKTSAISKNGMSPL